MNRREGSDHGAKVWRAIREKASHLNEKKKEKMSKVAMERDRTATLMMLAWWWFKRQEAFAKVTKAGLRYVTNYWEQTEEDQNRNWNDFMRFIIDSLERPAILAAEVSNLFHSLGVAETFGTSNRSLVADCFDRLLAKKARRGEFLESMQETLQSELLVKLVSLEKMDRRLAEWERERNRKPPKDGKKKPKGDPKRPLLPKKDTPCRYGANCKDLANGHCDFKHPAEHAKALGAKPPKRRKVDEDKGE